MSYESTDKKVSHPNHYQGKYGLEVIEVIKNFTADLKGIEAVDTANAIKYILRWKKKNGKQDIEKAIWYLTDLRDTLDVENDQAETEHHEKNMFPQIRKNWRNKHAPEHILLKSDDIYNCLCNMYSFGWQYLARDKSSPYVWAYVNRPMQVVSRNNVTWLPVGDDPDIVGIPYWEMSGKEYTGPFEVIQWGEDEDPVLLKDVLNQIVKNLTSSVE